MIFIKKRESEAARHASGAAESGMPFIEIEYKFLKISSIIGYIRTEERKSCTARVGKERVSISHTPLPSPLTFLLLVTTNLHSKATNYILDRLRDFVSSYTSIIRNVN